MSQLKPNRSDLESLSLNYFGRRSGKKNMLIDQKEDKRKDKWKEIGKNMSLRKFKFFYAAILLFVGLELFFPNHFFDVVAIFLSIPTIIFGIKEP